MRSSFFLSALMLATVHSFSRSLNCASTSSSLVGGGDEFSPSLLTFPLCAAAFALELAFESAFELLLATLSLSGRYDRTFAFDEFSFAAARSILGTKTAAAIPNPAMAIKSTARIPTTHGQTLRFAGGAAGW